MTVSVGEVAEASLPTGRGRGRGWRRVTIVAIHQDKADILDHRFNPPIRRNGFPLGLLRAEGETRHLTRI